MNYLDFVTDCRKYEARVKQNLKDPKALRDVLQEIRLRYLRERDEHRIDLLNAYKTMAEVALEVSELSAECRNFKLTSQSSFV